MAERTPEKAKEKEEKKSIYEKMTLIKMKLLGIKKTGKNEFSDYEYIELADILPILIPALQEERLYMKTVFSATEQVAKLIIVDMDSPSTTMEFETKVGSCTLKASHEIQNLGAAQTYTRRYLIITAFDIAAADSLDAGAEAAQDLAPKTKQQPTTKTQQTQPSKNKQTQSTETAPPQDDINQLRRETWALIKKLPKEEQAEWINACKGVDAAKLKQFINDLNAKLDAETQKAAQQNQREENLRKELLALIETLPEEVKAGWLDAAYYADGSRIESLLNEIKQVMQEQGIKPKPSQKSQGEELANQAAQGTATEKQKPAELQGKEIEIY